ncbi:MAG TPA: protein-glutamate O-methyltransferase CheR [Opitutaceae bacterium]
MDENQQLKHLLDTVLDLTGFDFRNYAYSSLHRRVTHRVLAEKLHTIEELDQKIRSDPEALEQLLRTLTIHVTSMFRDPGFFRVLREEVVPVWQTYPFIRLWVAGCSSGEEVFSLAILLHEADLLRRTRIYATDVSEPMLDRAKAAVYPLSSMQDFTKAYHDAGGLSDFADYYTADRESVIIRPFLRENIVFAAHNLVGDTSFNEFHGILCRNVMIYFNRTLQARVHRLLYESLTNFGYLGLGKSETIRYTEQELHYEEVSARERIYRKTR